MGLFFLLDVEHDLGVEVHVLEGLDRGRGFLLPRQHLEDHVKAPPDLLNLGRGFRKGGGAGKVYLSDGAIVLVHSEYIPGETARRRGTRLPKGGSKEEVC